MPFFLWVSDNLTGRDPTKMHFDAPDLQPDAEPIQKREENFLITFQALLLCSWYIVDVKTGIEIFMTFLPPSATHWGGLPAEDSSKDYEVLN